jgi:HEAT repeat protein
MSDWAHRRSRRTLFPDFDGDTAQLISALGDGERRYVAARWLAELHEQAAIPQLLSLTHSEDAKARRDAIRGLGDFAAKDALPRLRELAELDPDPLNRSWAAGSLGRIGSREAVPVLEKLLLSDERAVRHAAAYALGLIHDPSALPALRSARRKDRLNWWYLVLGRPVYRDAIRRLKKKRRVPQG